MFVFSEIFGYQTASSKKLEKTAFSARWAENNEKICTATDVANVEELIQAIDMLVDSKAQPQTVCMSIKLMGSFSFYRLI